MSESFKQADRAQTSVLTTFEKRTLLWLAKRIPAGVNSDHLTALGFISLIAAGASYAWARYEPYALLLVIVFLITNWFGDSLDGTLARYRQQQRPRYGFYIDHILDAIGMSILMCGMALSSYLSWQVAAAFTVAYLLLSIEIYLATYTIGTFHLSYWRFGPTELRILLAIGNLFALRRPTALVMGQEYLLFDIGFAVGTVALVLILVQATVSHTVNLYKEETKW